MGRSHPNLKAVSTRGPSGRSPLEIRRRPRATQSWLRLSPVVIAMTEFSNELWKSVTPLFDEILALPFNKELVAGTLSQDHFFYYLRQDSLYLVDFARALALTGTRCTDSQAFAELLGFANGALVAERELHRSYLGELPGGDLKKGEACAAYTSFLLSAANSEPVAVAMGALLPCFWIYLRVGQELKKSAVHNNPYGKWIEAYSTPEFAEVVNRAIGLTERLTHLASPQISSKVKEAFHASSRFELEFWKGAYLFR